MDIQSQQPSNVQPQNGAEQERRGVDRPGAPLVFVEGQSNARASASRRKRGRKPKAVPVAAPAAAAPQAIAGGNLAFLQAISQSSPPPTFTSLVRPQPRHAPFVPPGFQFFKDQNQQQFFNMSNPTPPSQAVEDFSSLIKQYQGEVDGYLRAQDEQLRRTLAEKWQRHCRTILCATEVAAARRIREKEAEAENAVRQCAELQERLARARADMMAWQTKAVTAQSRALTAQNSAAVLRAQLEQLMAGAPEGTGESAGGGLQLAEDSESAHVDLFPVPAGACHICRKGKAVVAVVPCGHLCVCTECDAARAAEVCPRCGILSSGTMHVFFC